MVNPPAHMFLCVFKTCKRHVETSDIIEFKKNLIHFVLSSVEFKNGFPFSENVSSKIVILITEIFERNMQCISEAPLFPLYIHSRR